MHNIFFLSIGNVILFYVIYHMNEKKKKKNSGIYVRINT